MAKRALIEKRPWLLASVAVAILFCALRLTRVPELWLLALPGAATGLLGLYAVLQHAGRDSHQRPGNKPAERACAKSRF